jgi:hypothetical protein
MQRLRPVQFIAIIERLRERLRPSLLTYLRTRVQVRGRRALRHVGRDVLGRATYALQTLAGCGLAEIHVRPSHIPNLPLAIRAELARLLQPGDVLVVRKELAVTNYFLPGHWPHVRIVGDWFILRSPQSKMCLSPSQPTILG